MSDDAACLHNLGPVETRQRLRIAQVGAVVGVLLLGTVIALEHSASVDLGRHWRFLVFIPAWIAALGWFQARSRT